MIITYNLTLDDINTTNNIEYIVSLPLSQELGATTLTVRFMYLNLLAFFRDTIISIVYNDRAYRLFEGSLVATDDNIYKFGFINDKFTVEIIE